jgi:sucrose-phosphate synthase
MNRSAVNVTSTSAERFEQYSHRAYRGAADVGDDDRFAVVPPGVNLVVFAAEVQTENDAQAVRRVEESLERDIDDARRHLPVIVASSRLDPKKNHVGLVTAYAQSERLQSRSNLVIITGALDDPLRRNGSASETERQVLLEVRQVVENCGLWGKISAFALPGQALLAAAYRHLAQRGSVFALTAHYEPFGLAPLEAAAAGLPVVVTRNGGPSESLREGDREYGVLVNPDDPADIARGLERVLCDREAWAAFAERGRQRVLNRYTWERTAIGYVELIERIVADPGARRAAGRLVIHPYFRDPRSGTDVSVAELAELYFGGV